MKALCKDAHLVPLPARKFPRLRGGSRGPHNISYITAGRQATGGGAIMWCSYTNLGFCTPIVYTLYKLLFVEEPPKNYDVLPHEGNRGTFHVSKVLKQVIENFPHGELPSCGWQSLYPAILWGCWAQALRTAKSRQQLALMSR